MMNMGVITNSTVGDAREEWYSLKGHELIKVMYDKREQITDKVLEYLR